MTSDVLTNQRFLYRKNNFLFFIIELISAETKKRIVEKKRVVNFIIRFIEE